MGLGLKPSEFVEGGIVPQDKNLTIKEARFNLFDYVNKAGEVVATTVALRVKTVDDDGGEYEQQYSVGAPKDFSPSVDNENPARDGKYIISITGKEGLGKSSNFYILMNNLVNAGFPENKLGDDISVLDGLYAYWIAIPEPKRLGLNRPTPAEGARERVLSVPSQIHRLPWEKKTTGKGAAKGAGKAASDGLVEKAVELVAHLVDAADDNTVNKTAVAQSIFKTHAKDAGTRDGLMQLVYTAVFDKALVDAGFTVDGQDISKAE